MLNVNCEDPGNRAIWTAQKKEQNVHIKNRQNEKFIFARCS